MSPILRLLSISALGLSTAAFGQDVPQPAPTVAPTAIPTPAPTPTVPAPDPTPVPQASPTTAPPAVADPVPQPIRTPASRPRATPTIAPAAEPAPVPIVAPSPAASPTAAPPPEIVAPLPTSDPEQGDRPLWPWAMGGALLLLGGIGLWIARRARPDAESYEEFEADIEVAPAAPPVSAPRITLAFRPTRAGFNMLSATVEGEVEIANDGDAAATDIRIRSALLSAHVGQAAELEEFHADPAGRVAVPAFALRPGERRTVRLVAAAARQGLKTMTAGGRPMFVPIFAIDVRIAGGGQVAQAFAVGIERVDSAKLAPFWLDVPPRTYSEVAARPHGAAIERTG